MPRIFKRRIFAGRFWTAAAVILSVSAVLLGSSTALADETATQLTRIAPSELSALTPPLGFGCALSRDGATIAIGAQSAGSATVLTGADSSWAEAASLTGMPGVQSVAVSGSQLLVGANPGPGQAFLDSVGSWSADPSFPAQASPSWVDVQGDLAVVGPDATVQPSTAATVYRRTAGVWAPIGQIWGQPQQFMRPFAISGSEIAAVDYASQVVRIYSAGPSSLTLETTLPFIVGFEGSVAFDGDNLAVGDIAPSSVQLFHRTNGTWNLDTTLHDTGSGNLWGWAVSLSGDSLAVGSPNEVVDGDGIGAVDVYQRGDGTWPRQTRIENPTPARMGSDGNWAAPMFGYAVSVNASDVLVGAPGEVWTDGAARGAAYLYRLSASVPDTGIAVSAGDNVSVTDPRTGARLVFDHVTTAGGLKVTDSASSASPGSLIVANQCYDLAFTGAFTGNVTITLPAAGSTGGARLVAGSGGSWADVTTAVDHGAKTVTGKVTTLASVAVVVPEASVDLSTSLSAHITPTYVPRFQGAHAHFGASSAIESGTAVIGDTLYNDVTILSRSGGVWSQIALLNPFYASAGSVGLSGDEILAGSNSFSNTPVAYTRTGGTWSPDTLPVLGSPTAPTDVAVSGNIGVAAPLRYDVTNLPFAEVFSKASGSWVMVGTVPAAGSSGWNTTTVGLAASGSEIAVLDTSHSAVRICSVSASSVTVEQTIHLLGFAGNALALDGDNLAVGDAGDDAVRIYHRTGGVFGLEKQLALSGGGFYGYGLALHGDVLAVGSTSATTSNGESDGAVTLYRRLGGSWPAAARVESPLQGGTDSGGNYVFPEFGTSAALDTGELLVGAIHQRDPSDGTVTGGAFIYSLAESSTPVAFADAHLEAAVRSALGISAPTPVTQADMLGLSTLDAHGLGITSLSGLEYATDLTSLDLGNDELTDISQLSGMRFLTTLAVDHNWLDTTGGSAAMTTIATLQARGTTVTYLPQKTHNHAPVASAVSVTTSTGVAAQVTFSATDADNDALTYSVVGGPAHGSLGSVSGAHVTYTPAAGFSGSDAFTYKANDGAADSNVATVTITVVSPATIATGTGVSASDGGVTVTFASVSAPGTLTVTPLAPRHSDPANFRLLPDVYFDISPSATFTGLATVTLHIPGTYTGDLSKLVIFHWKNNGWEQITPIVNVAARTATFTTSSFSDFGIAEPVSPTPTPAPTPTTSTPASSEWSLSLLALAGMLAAAWTLRKTRLAEKP